MRYSIISLTMVFTLSPALAFAAEGSGFDLSQWLSDIMNQSNSESETVVQTNLNVSTNTGGNSASNGGTVITGDKTVEVHIRQEVNGETIEPIDIVVDENSG